VRSRRRCQFRPIPTLDEEPSWQAGPCGESDEDSDRGAGRRGWSRASARLSWAPASCRLPTAPAQAADGQGFNLNASDLAFILEQIKIAERHASTPLDPADPCAGLLGPAADQIPNQNAQGAELPWGLRTVDGSCNNLKAGQSGTGPQSAMSNQVIGR
jgi:hypothetical protein